MHFLSTARLIPGATLFSRFAEPPPGTSAPPVFAVVHSPSRGRRGLVFPPGPSSEKCIRAGPRGGSRPPVPTQPDEIWDSIRAELRRETPDFKFHIWLDPLRLAAIRGETVFVRAPDHIRTSVTERYLPLLRRAASTAFDERALVEVVGEDWEAPPEGGATDGAGGPRSPRAGGHAADAHGDRGRLNPKYTLRPVRDRRRQPLRTRRVAGRGRAARAFLQPALPARLARDRQDASAPRHRQLRRALRIGPAGSLRDDRRVHRRVRPGREERRAGGLQAALPRRRRGPDRRRPVPGRPRQDARGVLPHLQRAWWRRAASSS